jgi:hypothetical protein
MGVTYPLPSTDTFDCTLLGKTNNEERDIVARFREMITVEDVEPASFAILHHAYLQQGIKMEIAVPATEKVASRTKGRASAPKTGDMVSDTHCPRTALGKRLLALRRAYVMKGGKLLDENALAAEIKRRKGQDGD